MIVILVTNVPKTAVFKKDRTCAGSIGTWRKHSSKLIGGKKSNFKHTHTPGFEPSHRSPLVAPQIRSLGGWSSGGPVAGILDRSSPALCSRPTSRLARWTCCHFLQPRSSPPAEERWHRPVCSAPAKWELRGPRHYSPLGSCCTLLAHCCRL